MRLCTILTLFLIVATSVPGLGDGFEIGDAIYNSLNVFGLDSEYDHSGLIYLARPDFEDPRRLPIIDIIEGRKDEGVVCRPLVEFGMEFGPYACATGFDERLTIIAQAKMCEGKDYVLIFGNSLDALLPLGETWEGTVADIDRIRCDGLVEYCHNIAGLQVFHWIDGAGGGATGGINSSLVLPFYNDLPPIYSPHDPCYFFPKSQRGVAGECTGGGPGGYWVGSGTTFRPQFDDLNDTRISEIFLGVNGEDKISVVASDPSSGISYLRYTIVSSDDLSTPPPPPSEGWGTLGAITSWAELQPEVYFEQPARWRGFYYFQAVDGAGNLSDMEVVAYEPLVPDGVHPLDDRTVPGIASDLMELEKCGYPEYDIYLNPQEHPLQSSIYLAAAEQCEIREMIQNLDTTEDYTVIGKDMHDRERRVFRLREPRGERSLDFRSQANRSTPGIAALVRGPLGEQRGGGDRSPGIKTSAEVIEDPEATDLIIYSSSSSALSDADMVCEMYHQLHGLTSQIVLGEGSSYQECRAVAEAVYNECLSSSCAAPPLLIMAGTCDRFGSQNDLVSAVPYAGGTHYSDNLIVDFDGDRIPEIPCTRLPIFSSFHYEVEYLQWLLAQNAISFNNLSTFPGGGVVLIDGSYHAVLNGGDPADYLCVDNPNLTATSLELATLYIESNIPCQVINPDQVSDDHDPCWPTEEKGDFIRVAMSGAGEVFAIGRRSLPHISPGDFLKTSRHDTADWPDLGYVFNMFCCKTASDELDSYHQATSDALMMKWMLGNALTYPQGGHTVSYIGCRQSGIIGEHIELATEFATLRQEGRFRFHQEVLFEAIRNVALRRPEMIDYLNQVVSFGWPTPIMDTPVGIPSRGTDQRAGQAPAIDLRCYPNPFNPTLHLELDQIGGGGAKVTIHDVAGRLIKEFPPLADESSRHRLTWDGTDGKGVAVGSGVYFVRAKLGEAAITRKAVLLK